MSQSENVKKLTELGAECVGGDLIWKGKLLGRFRNGEFHITDEGTEALNIEDAVVKAVTPRKAKAKATEMVGDVNLDDVLPAE